MVIYNVHEAKTNLSRLLAKVAKGEQVIISKAGVPVATIEPYAPANKAPRQMGALRGKMIMSDDFDNLPDELMKYFT